jgi:hypothetical protein
MGAQGRSRRFMPADTAIAALGGPRPARLRASTMQVRTFASRRELAESGRSALPMVTRQADIGTLWLVPRLALAKGLFDIGDSRGG